MARRMATTIRICGPGDSGCWVYGEKRADEHLWGRAKTTKPREHGHGPLCQACGLPLGTWQYEIAMDVHQARTGHGLHTGVCWEKCGEDVDIGPDLAEALRDTVQAEPVP